MSISKLVLEKLGENKLRGSNYQVKTCPFCGRSEGKFYIHAEKGMYKCHHGKCGEKGNLQQLYKHLGIEEAVPKTDSRKAEKVETIKLRGEDFSLPSDKTAENLIEYWEGRGIGKDTILAVSPNILKSKKYNRTAFLYRESEESAPCMVKYKSFTNEKPLAEAGSRAILWNMDKAVSKKLIITEGEPDALTLMECGLGDRVVSIPFGCGNHHWIDNCYEFLSAKEEIIIIYDDDEPGKNGFETVKNRLSDMNVKTADLKGYNDVNEFFMFEGKEELLKTIDLAYEVYISEISDYYSVPRLNLNDIERIKTGVHELDRKTRGFKAGELVVLAGDNGSGKTTLAKQIMLECFEQDKKAFVYNGEIDDRLFKEDLFKQANGNEELEKIPDNLIKDCFLQVVKEDNYQKINEWLKGKMYFLQSELMTEEKHVKSAMISAAKRQGCFLFLVDNLTSIKLDTSSGDSLHNLQGDFAVWLKGFARKYECCVVLVNHMTKSNDKGNKNKDNIKGSGIITDVCDITITITRAEDDEEKDAVLSIHKNRMIGDNGKTNLSFCPRTRRFFTVDREETLRDEYSWKKLQSTAIFEIDIDNLPY